jgi:hypothetical protein
MKRFMRSPTGRTIRFVVVDVVVVDVVVVDVVVMDASGMYVLESSFTETQHQPAKPALVK